VKERLTVLGAEPYVMNPTQFGEWFSSETKAMAKVIKDGKVTVD
jgi:hypothetical protein